MSANHGIRDAPIRLRVSNQKAYVWDVDDIALIRSKHRLCGVLSGTLPHLSQQNVFLGVPLVLLPEEAVLLVNTGAGVLVDDPSAHTQPFLCEISNWNAEQEESMKAQLSLLHEKVAQESKKSDRGMSEDAQRKRREREEKKRAKALAKARDDGAAEAGLAPITPEAAVGTSSVSPTPLESSTSTASAAPEASASAGSPSTEPTFSVPSSLPPFSITIPASSTGLSWYNDGSSTSHPDINVYRTIDSAKAAGIWSYPSNLNERARCGVFRALWEQGYFMGGGIRFGGEYLVYPGDPLRYHSHFTASVVDSPTFPLRPMEIVAHGRLGTATKKNHLLCSWDDEKQEVKFLTIQWAGFG